jgi:hypothetical protein
VVYQKDLGDDTLAIFRNMTLYNPDKTWKPTSDDWPFDAPRQPSASEAADDPVQ